MIRSVMIALEHWCVDDESIFIGIGKLIFLILGAMFLVTLPFACASERASRTAYARCLDRGMGWAVVGTHTEYHSAKAGGGAYQVRDYGCVPVSR